LSAGVELTRAQDVAKAAEIEAWVDRVAATYNVLPMDARAFRWWARLMCGRSDQLIEDAMIAATAIVHNLIVVTRNLRDFAPFDVRRGTRVRRRRYHQALSPADGSEPGGRGVQDYVLDAIFRVIDHSRVGRRIRAGRR
jgi:hypothetical protein